MLLEKLQDLFHLIYSIPELIAWGGYFILFVIIFAETGLMVGFFLPGDSLLVVAGLFAARGDINLYFLIFLLSFAAIIGDSLGYWIGKKTGHALFHKKESKFFKRKYLIAAQEFYDKHGGKTIFLARFIPIIRTFAPVIAGIAHMKYKRFVSFNIFGGIFWVTSMLLLGYFLGRVIPNIDKNIEFIILIVIFLSILPMVVMYYKRKNKKYKIKHPEIENKR